MTAEPNDDWPTYKSGASYKKHFHAVGVLVANWSMIERAYEALFQFMFQGNIKLSQRSFELLGNQSRWQLISDICGELTTPEQAEHIQHFLRCAAICKENRNAVAHADYQNGPDEETIRLLKGRNKADDSVRDYHFNVASIRQIADEAHLVGEYGFLIFLHLESARVIPPEHRATLHLPLLYKPPVPKKWDLHSLTDQTGAPRQP